MLLGNVFCDIVSLSKGSKIVTSSTPFYISTKGVCIMQINKLSQSNLTSFNGYVNVKCIDGKLVRVKKGMPGSIKMFIAGGKGIDEKVALANKKLVQDLQSVTKENKPNSVLIFFAVTKTSPSSPAKYFSPSNL